MTSPTFLSIRPGTPGRARLIYAGLLLGLIVPGLNVGAAVLAHLGRSKGDAVIQEHARNQVHIFWKSVVYVITGLVLTYFLFGVLIIMAAIVWYILRIAGGLRALSAGAPPANSESWLL